MKMEAILRRDVRRNDGSCVVYVFMTVPATNAYHGRTAEPVEAIRFHTEAAARAFMQVGRSDGFTRTLIEDARIGMGRAPNVV